MRQRPSGISEKQAARWRRGSLPASRRGNGCRIRSAAGRQQSISWRRGHGGAQTAGTLCSEHAPKPTTPPGQATSSALVLLNLLVREYFEK